jgi:hypothetical protein
MVLALLDGHHALDTVDKRLEERGIVALLQPELTRATLNDYRLGIGSCTSSLRLIR